MIVANCSGFKGAPCFNLFAPRILLAGCKTKRAGHVSHGGAGSIRNHVCNLRRMVSAVSLINVLNDLFATTTLDINIDIWRAISFW